MEIDHKKESEDTPHEATIDHLPNEILLMIFQQFTFRQLIKATAVCHRWNELIFYSLKDRVNLRLPISAVGNTREWTANRFYKRAFCEGQLGRNFDSSCLQPMARKVRRMELTCTDASEGGLMEFLRPFESVEILQVRVNRFSGRNQIPGGSYGGGMILPWIRHLTVTCSDERMFDLLAKVAPRLVTLDVEFPLANLLPDFYRCRFGRLESLNLRINTGQALRLAESFSNADLLRFLHGMRALRKLGLFVDVNSVFHVAFGLKSVQHLTLGGVFTNNSYRAVSPHNALTPMRFSEQSLSSKDPLPAVTTFKFQGTYISPQQITRLFPNLKTLSIPNIHNLDMYDARLITAAYRDTLEALSIRIYSANHNAITAFDELKKLRRLCVYSIKHPEGALHGTIARLGSLRELHLRGLRGDAWIAALPALRNANRSCAISVNHLPIEHWLRGSRM